MTMRDWLGIAVPLALAVFGFMRWRSNGYWMPRYIHVLAAFALLLGVGLAWMSISTDAPNAGRIGWLVPVMPLLVYWAFMVYGTARAVRQLNPFLSLHPSMDSAEVVGIMRREFSRFREMDYANLQILCGTPTKPLGIVGDSGRRYEMRVMARAAPDAPHGTIEVVGLLGELGRKRGVPVAIAGFGKTAAGAVIDDALAAPIAPKYLL
jgi:hypothetical protein